MDSAAGATFPPSLSCYLLSLSVCLRVFFFLTQSRRKSAVRERERERTKGGGNGEAARLTVSLHLTCFPVATWVTPPHSFLRLTPPTSSSLATEEKNNRCPHTVPQALKHRPILYVCAFFFLVTSRNEVEKKRKQSSRCKSYCFHQTQGRVQLLLAIVASRRNGRLPFLSASLSSPSFLSFSPHLFGSARTWACPVHATAYTTPKKKRGGEGKRECKSKRRDEPLRFSGRQSR